MLAACPSGEIPTSWTALTPGTRLSSVTSREMAEPSAGVSEPPTRLATMVTTASLGPWNGAASNCAWLLGELAGRKAELLLFSWLARLGRKCTARTAPTSHSTRIGQRSRTHVRQSAQEHCRAVCLWDGSGEVSPW